MIRTQKPNRENSLYVFLSFALVGGFLEAYTFLLHGGVFCNAQTGNLVLLFLKLVNGEWSAASHYLYSLLAYVAGILVSLALPLFFRRSGPHCFVAALEAAAFIALAFVPAGAPDWYTYVSVSFLCALQYNTFTECRGSKLATTFCTNNLRQATIGLFDGVRRRDGLSLRRAGMYGGIILTFAAGAVGGAFAARYLGNFCTLLAAALLLPVVLFLLPGRGGREQAAPTGGALAAQPEANGAPAADIAPAAPPTGGALAAQPTADTSPATRAAADTSPAARAAGKK